MPGSSLKGKINILDFRRGLSKIESVLDIGPGWGTYVKLLKRRGEIWDAVEIFEPYVKKFGLRNLYNQVFISDALTFVPQKKYDLVILGDVLEHVSKDDGIKLLGKIMSYAGYVIVSLPLDGETGVDQQNSHDYWNNPNEKHLARWSNRSFISCVGSLEGEIIALEKFREIGVYLLAAKSTKNYLDEKNSAFDFMKHKKFSLDGGKSFTRTIKYYVWKTVPTPAKKIIKKSRAS